MISLPNITKEFYFASLPILILGIGGIAAMLQHVVPKYNKVKHVFSLQLLILSGALLSVLSNTNTSSYLNGAYQASRLSSFGQVFILVIGFIVTIFFKSHILEKEFFRPEISSIYQMVLLGMLVMISSFDLITIYVGLEISSIGIYSLVGYINPSRASLEGGMKYFVLGSLSSAFLLFGIGLLYLSFGTLNLTEMLTKLYQYFEFKAWINTGILLVLIGLAFKLALFPFHMWAPDVYESAPTGITGFMATTMKVMIILVIMRFSALGSITSFHQWLPAMFFMAAASMLVGNVLALVQTNIKRTLAYSAIAHSGYIAIGLCAMGSLQVLPYKAVLFYLIIYCTTSLLAFGCLMFMETNTRENIHLSHLKGLAQKRPWLCLAFSIALLSFAGLPPTVGFLGKFFIFNEAIKGQLFPLVIIGVIGSVISLYYYLRIIVYMYMHQPSPDTIETKQEQPLLLQNLMVLPFALLLLVGTLFPAPIMKYLDPIVKTIAVRQK